MDAQTKQALDHLINRTASAAEINLLRQKLDAGQISMRGDVNHSVIILGDGNTVNQYQLNPEMVDALKRRKLAASVPLRNPIVEGIHLLPYDYDQKIQNFLKEYLGDEQHPVPFGGRGKSALLVRWLDSLSARENMALAFVPVNIRFGANMERAFHAAISARLACLHGDDVPFDGQAGELLR